MFNAGFNALNVDGVLDGGAPPRPPPPHEMAPPRPPPPETDDEEDFPIPQANQPIMVRGLFVCFFGGVGVGVGMNFSQKLDFLESISFFDI
jgi:hypothetical protein